MQIAVSIKTQISDLLTPVKSPLPGQQDSSDASHGLQWTCEHLMP